MISVALAVVGTGGGGCYSSYNYSAVVIYKFRINSLNTVGLIEGDYLYLV